MNETIQDTAGNVENLAEVGKYPTLEQAHEHGLVILAMREPCLIAEAETPGQYSLQAEPAATSQIASELQAYENEKGIPRLALPERELFRFSAGWEVYGIWMLALVACFLWQQGHPAFSDLAASSSTGLICHGEWWRPFTALFLHADPPHLLGNLLSGLLFGTLVARTIGAWRGWALILTCGTIGNALTSALTWPEEFTSIGASTAVFGALGILSGLGFSAMLRARLHLPWAKTAAPVLAGIILLGWLGGGQSNGNTDVLGHVFGFGTGLTAGIGIGVLSRATADASTDGTATAARDGRI
jgi:membrane associated rhomboid family serine protease